jgi:hypothetical protein
MDSPCSNMQQQQHNSFRIDRILTGIGPTTIHHGDVSVSKVFCKEEDKKRTSASSTDDEEEVFRKKKKPRTAFSREQVTELEKKFTERKYLSSAERGELAEKLKLSDMQVKTWFQNRRMKYKRQTEEAELEVKSPKFPYTPFVSCSSIYGYNLMPYKADPSSGTPTYGYSPEAFRICQSSDSYSSGHFSPTPQVSPTYFSNTPTGVFTPLSPLASCHQIGNYVTTGDYNSLPYNVDWQRSLSTPSAP